MTGIGEGGRSCRLRPREGINTRVQQRRSHMVQRMQGRAISIGGHDKRGSLIGTARGGGTMRVASRIPAVFG